MVKGKIADWLRRGIFYFGLWIVFTGLDPDKLPVGLAAALLASATSLALLPPGTLHPRLLALPAGGLRFLRLSVAGGVDIAWRAFHPRVPLHPGLVLCPLQQLEGTSRNAFASLTSLLPGTLVIGSSPEGLLYHCLDTDQPVTRQLEEEQVAFRRMIPPPASD